jgi:copper resistance protein B
MSTMRPTYLALAIAGLIAANPALAQHQGHDMGAMPGMVMPAPKPKPVPKKPAAKKPATKAVAAKKPASPTHAGARTARVKAAAPAKSAHARAESNTHDMASMPGMDMSGMDHSHMTHPPAAPATATHQHADHAGAATPESASPAAAEQGMEHAGHDMSSMPGMDMSGMDHSTMDMPTAHDTGSHDLPADSAPREPIPSLTDADRAAAFPPLAAGHPSHDAMTHTYWLADRFEVRADGKGGAWEGTAWIGRDVDRLWLRTEGDTEHGRVERGNLEALYGHSITPWWDVVAGAKQEFGEGPSRTYAAFGVQGLAPYKFEVEATAYVGNGGRTAATVEAEYDTLITNRLVLQWQGEADLYGRTDPAIGVGSGLSTVDAGARLRYEITRRFAPYVGVEVERAFGGTAELRREQGRDTTDTRIVAGIRFWF